MWLRPKLGTDVAWLNGMMHVIIRDGLYDKHYVAERTVCFDSLQKTVERYTPEHTEKITGIPRGQIIEAARLYAQAGAASIFYAMGITQHVTGTDNVKSIANLAMLCGNVGVRGGGVNPLRGQNNVQGACDMGVLPNVYSGYQSVADPEVRGRMARAWGFDSLPETSGLTVTDMMEAARAGRLKALYVIGENPLVSDPDLHHAMASIENLEFLVVQDIFLTETALRADVVLPAASFAEKDGTFTNTERKVQRVRRAVPPPGEAREDWQIISALAQRLGCSMTCRNSRDIMEEIAQVTPSYAGIAYNRIANNGLHWPCTDSGHPGTPCLHTETFASGKGTFHAIDYKPPAEIPDNDYPFSLTTGRVMYQYHTRTMTMRTPGLDEREPECFVEIASEDAMLHDVRNNDLLRVASRRGFVTARARITDSVSRGVLFMPFHYADAAANILTNPACDPVAKIPEYKVCAVRIEKCLQGDAVDEK